MADYFGLGFWWVERIYLLELVGQLLCKKSAKEIVFSLFIVNIVI